MKKCLKRILAGVLAIVLCFGITQYAVQANSTNEVALSLKTYVADHSNAARFYIVFDAPGVVKSTNNGSYYATTPILIDEQSKATTGNTYFVSFEDNQIALVLAYEDLETGVTTAAGLTKKHTLTIPARTLIGDTYTVKEDVNLIIENGTVKADTTKKITLGWNSCFAQDDWKRFLIYFTASGVEVADYYAGNSLIIDGKQTTTNTSNMYFVSFEAGVLGLLLPYDQLETGVTTAAGLQKTHTLTIPEGAVIGDKYRVTEDFTLTYYNGTWIKDCVTIGITSVAEGTVLSEMTSLDDNYELVVFDGVGVETQKYTGEGGGYLLYLSSVNELPGENNDSTKFTGIQMSVNGGAKFSPTIIHSSTAGMAFIHVTESHLPSNISEDIELVIHAGKGESNNNSYKGIYLAQDCVLTLNTQGSWSIQPVDTMMWNVKLESNNINDFTQDIFSVSATIDGKTLIIPCTYDGDSMSLSIANASINKNGSTLVLKAGIYVGENDATISLLEDTKLCFNEYGLAIGQPIKPNTTGVEFALNKKANQQSMISLSGLKADAFTQGSTLQAASGVLNGVYYSKDSGIFLNSEVLTEDMVSFSKNGTYSIELSGVSVAEGTQLLLTGLYTDGEHLVEYVPTVLVWDGSSWSIQMETTYLSGDTNSDGAIDVRDLARIKRYLCGNTDTYEVGINLLGADMIADNEQRTIDKYDVQELRLSLIVAKQIKMAAYSGPGFRHNSTTGKNWISESDFQDYMDCGFTYLYPEGTAAYNMAYDYTQQKNSRVSSFAKSDLYKYMTLAEKMNIPVVTLDYQVVDIIDQKQTELTDANKNYLSQMVTDLSQFNMFKGYTLRDEPKISNVSSVKAVKDYMNELMPGSFSFTSNLPLYSDTAIGFYTQKVTSDSVVAYKDYVDQMSSAEGSFSYDFYPLLQESRLGGWLQTTKVIDTWFQNLEIVADSAKTKGYDAGITIQSMGYKPLDSDGDAIFHKRPIGSKADVGFQMYSALAYGIKNVNYYTYWGDKNTELYTALVDYKTDGTVAKTSAYDYVREVNWEIRKFDHVLLDFDWKGTTIVKGYSSSDAITNATNYTDSRISSTSVNEEMGTSTDAIIGCMQDSLGRDGYMLVNATDPYKNTTVKLTVTFKDAQKATVYIGGEEQRITLNNGSYTFTLGAGEGVFVILE